MEDHAPKYFDDDGTEINPDLVPKPDLCISCKKDGQPGQKEILCNLTRPTNKEMKSFIAMLMSLQSEI